MYSSMPNALNLHFIEIFELQLCLHIVGDDPIVLNTIRIRQGTPHFFPT